jgi:hypothetical protein
MIRVNLKKNTNQDELWNQRIRTVEEEQEQGGSRSSESLLP